MVRSGRDRRSSLISLAPRRSCFWTTQYLLSARKRGLWVKELDRTAIQNSFWRGVQWSKSPTPRNVGAIVRSTSMTVSPESLWVRQVPSAVSSWSVPGTRPGSLRYRALSRPEFPQSIANVGSLCVTAGVRDSLIVNRLPRTD